MAWKSTTNCTDFVPLKWSKWIVRFEDHSFSIWNMCEILFSTFYSLYFCDDDDYDDGVLINNTYMSNDYLNH